MTVLSVQNLNVFYGRTQRLFGVALPPLEEGDVLGLLGPNAAGKSTLMRALAGVQPSLGQILYRGVAQKKMARGDWQAQVAYLPQTPPQESSLRPLELLWSAARALALPLADRVLADRIDGLLARLGLQDFALTPLHALSGGKRQLVGLALALLRDPHLLLLDEPTSALDLHWRMVVLDLVQERVRTGGGAAIAAVHDLDLAARYCNKLVLLDAGRILAAGSAAEVLTPAHLARVFQVETQVGTGCLGHPLVQVLGPLRGSSVIAGRAGTRARIDPLHFPVPIDAVADAKNNDNHPSPDPAGAPPGAAGFCADPAVLPAQSVGRHDGG